MKVTTTKMIRAYSLFLILVVLGPGVAWAQQTTNRPGPSVASASVGDAPGTMNAAPGTPVSQSRIQIGPGDLLNVSVFDVPEMTQTIRVSDVGTAAFSLIGSVHVAGLTTDEARTLIAQKLKQGNFILDPQVYVLISEYSTQGVSVLGEVNKPGVYTVLGQRSLLDVISEAGGTTPAAGPDATVKHLDGTTLSVRLTKNAKESLASDIALLPGDKLIIPRAGIVYILGEVSRPGGFIMENDGNMSLLQAVAMAGGVNRTASMNRSKLIRKTANGYTEVPVPLKKLLQGGGGDMQLESEDIVYIPTNVAKSAIYRTTPAILADASSAAIYRGIP